MFFLNAFLINVFIIEAVPSTAFKKTFPSNPPVTITSASPFKAYLASILPWKPSILDALNNLCASLTTGLPFSSSAPLLNK